MNDILTKASIEEIKKRMSRPIEKTSLKFGFNTKGNKEIISILRGDKIEDWIFIASTKSWEKVSKP